MDALPRTNIHYDILQSIRSSYDVVKDETIREKALELIESETDLKYCKIFHPLEKTIMKMKNHILSALREQFESWQTLLASLREEQTTTPHFDLDWSIKDVMAHLWAWQQISIARIEAGLANQEPQFPKWIVDSVPDWDENADQVNAVTFDKNHSKSWRDVYENWKTGFLQLIEVSEKISERDLLDGDRYPWLRGYSLAFILIASYEHHQEHYDKLTKWLQESTQEN